MNQVLSSGSWQWLKKVVNINVDICKIQTNTELIRQKLATVTVSSLLLGRGDEVGGHCTEIYADGGGDDGTRVSPRSLRRDPDNNRFCSCNN